MALHPQKVLQLLSDVDQILIYSLGGKTTTSKGEPGRGAGGGADALSVLAALGEHVDFELKADTLLCFKGCAVESWKNSPWRSPTCPKMEHVSRHCHGTAVAATSACLVLPDLL